MRWSRIISIAAAALALLSVGAASASADAFGPQIPVTNFGPPGDPEFKAGFHDVAYNPATGQYLVVFIGSTTTDTDDVYGQLLDGAGNPVGGPFRISTVSQSEDNYNPATVFHNPDANQFLVVWDRAETVYARLVSGDGAPLGGGEFAISATQDDIETQAIAYNPILREYLVGWKAFADGRVYVQRLMADGSQVAPDDRVVGGSAALTADDAMDLVYNATSQEFLVVFNAFPSGGGDDEEVYAQRLALDGSEIGTDDFRISDMGPPGDDTFDASPPSVAWNSRDNQYLVAWHGNDGPPLGNGEREAYGQLLSADGTEIGPSDFRISDMGADGQNEPGAFRPRIVYDPNAHQYFAAWHGDDLSGGMVDNEFEIYGQYLAPHGTEIGTNDFQISDMPPAGDTTNSGNRPAIAFNSASCDYLVTWFGGAPNVSADGDWDVFARRVSAPPCPPPPAPISQPAPQDTTRPVISRMRLSRAVIAASANARAAQRRRRLPRSTTARYRLTEAASVLFTVQRRTRGRRVGRRCRRATRRNRSRRPCARWVKVGRSFRQQARAGNNRKTFSRRTIRRRRLAVGTYRLAAVATDAARNRSRQRTARFRVRRRR